MKKCFRVAVGSKVLFYSLFLRSLLSADKGNKTVVLDTSDYEEKAYNILNKPIFEKILKDPTTRNERKVNHWIKQLEKNDKDNDDVFKRLQVALNGTKPAGFYASVKIRKKEHPLRLISEDTHLSDRWK